MGEIFSREFAVDSLPFTGERLTSAVTGVGHIEVEHFHRYFIARECCRGHDVLDVASGEGYGSAFLAQVASSVIGVEISRAAVAHAQHAYPYSHLRFVVGDARQLPLHDGSVDVVVSFETIEHIVEQEKFVAEVRRVLRPGGLFVVSTPDRDIYSPADTTANEFHRKELTKPEFIRLLRGSFREVDWLMQRAVNGSVAMPETALPELPKDGARGSVLTFEMRGEKFFEVNDGLPRATYILAFASDHPVRPPLASAYIETAHIPPLRLNAAEAEVASQRTRASAAEQEAIAQRRRAEGAEQKASALDARAAAEELDVKKQTSMTEAAHLELSEIRLRLQGIESTKNWRLLALFRSWLNRRKNADPKSSSLNANDSQPKVGISASSSPTSIQFNIDHVLNIEGAGLLLIGWVLRSRADTVCVELTLDYAHLPPISPVWLDRPDVALAFFGSETRAPVDHGFALFVPIPTLEGCANSLVLTLRSPHGLARETTVAIPPPLPPIDGLYEALRLLPTYSANLLRLLPSCIVPLADASWAAWRSQTGAMTVVDFGTPADAPEVSIIVPLFGRIDFIRHQLAAFANDPAFGSGGNAELIYVLDDPPRVGELREIARQLYDLYHIAFRIIELSRNHGYSGANNAGAATARGRLVLLLNSDVLPKASGWLGQMIESFDRLPECGALGCRLLYEDGTLQHAGMQFTPFSELPDTWVCLHPLKGIPAALDFPAQPRLVPAVTGACLMVPRRLYEELGGLSEDYVIADFEDADLCHKIAERGLAVWYDPTIELYHFERQSVSGRGSEQARYLLTLANMWKHGVRWKDRLMHLSSSEPLPLEEVR